MQNLSRMLFVIGITAFSVAISANACKSKKQDGGAQLEVKSLDETTAKVVEKDGIAHVNILETKVFGKAAAASQTYAAYVAKDVLKDVFSVSVKDAKAGFVIANAYSKATSIDKITAEIVVTNEDGKDQFTSNIPKDGKAEVNFGIVSTWIEKRGFKPKKGGKSIGLICVSAFDSISQERATEIITTVSNITGGSDTEKEAAKKSMEKATDKLSGSEKSVCSTGGNSITESDYKGWVTAAKADSSGVVTIQLLFAGFDFGASTLGDFYKGNPDIFTKGVTSETVKGVIGSYPHGVKKVHVNIVEGLE